MNKLWIIYELVVNINEITNIEEKKVGIFITYLRGMTVGGDRGGASRKFGGRFEFYTSQR